MARFSNMGGMPDGGPWPGASFAGPWLPLGFSQASKLVRANAQDGRHTFVSDNERRWVSQCRAKNTLG